MAAENRDSPKLLSVPSIVARLLNRLMGMGRGMWMVILVKDGPGGRGIVTWSVVEMPLEPKDALPNGS